jgi:hypothetical protein
MLGWAQGSFHKKSAGTHFVELVFLHPVGSAGQLVHFSASEARNVITLFFMLGWNRYGFDKNTLGHVMPILCFCNRWDLWVT